MPQQKCWKRVVLILLHKAVVATPLWSGAVSAVAWTRTNLIRLQRAATCGPPGLQKDQGQESRPRSPTRRRIVIHSHTQRSRSSNGKTPYGMVQEMEDLHQGPWTHRSIPNIIRSTLIISKSFNFFFFYFFEPFVDFFSNIFQYTGHRVQGKTRILVKKKLLQLSIDNT